MSKKVIISDGFEKEVSQRGFTILANYVRAVQKFRQEHGAAKLNVMYWENMAIEFLKNPLIELKEPPDEK